MRGQQLPCLARKRRADGHVPAEGPDPCRIIRAQVFDELRCAIAKQRQVALHAAGHVEHDDETNRPWRTVEEDDRLRLAIVADLEIVLAQRRDQAAVLIGDGHKRANELASSAKDRRRLWFLLLSLRLLRLLPG